MEKEITITHSMTFKDLHYYDYNNKSLKFLKNYDDIEQQSIVKWKDGLKLRIYGTRTIYGYRIENNGFYDVINDDYMSEERIKSDIKLLEIKELKGCSYTKKLARK